jgi:hypothetical protein
MAVIGAASIARAINLIAENELTANRAAAPASNFLP